MLAKAYDNRHHFTSGTPVWHRDLQRRGHRAVRRKGGTVISRPEATIKATFDATEFQTWFTAISTIGATREGGVHRPFGSDEDKRVREWLIATARTLDLLVSVDAAGNIWGTLPGHSPDLPALIVGSHHDSVPQGGRFDGPLGVLAGLSVVSALTRAGIKLRHPLGFVSFTAEEPNPFGLSTLGSRLATDRLEPAIVHRAVDASGRTLRSALAAVGGDVERLATARKTARDIAAFLELHIEQGLRLQDAGIPVGVVTGICGIYREQIRVIGEANHAGTTRLRDRHDALLAGAELALCVEASVRAELSDEVIGTVGAFAIQPGATNIIPGSCDLVMELRAGTAAQRTRMLERIEHAVSEMSVRRGVQIKRTVALDQPEQAMDSLVQATLTACASARRIPTQPLFSMAGHDATHLATITRAGMLFVPSLGGRSHCPEEVSRPQDIEAAIQVLIDAVVALDHQLHPCADGRTARLHGERE